MSDEKTIEFEIDNNGKVTMKGKGFKGPECIKEMKEYEELFEILESQKTDEYYEQQVVSTKIKATR